MDPLTGIVVIAAVLLLAYKSGALQAIAAPTNSYTGPAPIIPATSIAGQTPMGLQPNFSISAPAVIPPPPQKVTGPNLTQLGITSAVTVGTAALTAPASFAAIGLTGAAAGAAVAGIGAVAAIAAALWAAHEQRKAQAQDENAAVNIGVPGYDNAMRTINAAYNSRQITATDAISLVQQVMQMYWQEVTPKIQPGRNGCNGGGGCPPWPASGNGCSGSIGAACCVGCYDLAGGPAPHVFTAAQGGDGVTPLYFGAMGTQIVLANGGGPVLYQAVIASSYGTKARPAYVLNWQQTSAA